MFIPAAAKYFDTIMYTIFGKPATYYGLSLAIIREACDIQKEKHNIC
jgi:hypothetical protein